MAMKLLKGLGAGVAGTVAMTGHQKIRQRIARRDEYPDADDDSTEAGEERDPWTSAPAPAQAGKRLIEGLLRWRVPARAIPVLTQVMHWSYGTFWGGVYAAGGDRWRGRPAFVGPMFGLGIWAASYAQLVPLGIYEPPWRYPAGALADELAYHLTYGTTVALTYALITGEIG
jgi:hypothetical protein